jgi:hypothetical protein
MENEIIMNEEVFETVEETTESGKGLKVAAGIGIVAIVGALAYKFVAKPIAAKIKAKKAQKQAEADGYIEGEIVDSDEN